MDLTPEQQSVRRKIIGGAVMWTVVVTVIAFALVFWLAANAGDIVRWLLAIVVAAGAGFFVYRWRYNSGVSKSVCRKCGTAFGIREVERNERFLSSEPKQRSEAGQAATKISRGTNKVTTWTEEKYEVTAIDECFNCHDRTERKWTATREKDRVEREVPA